MKRIAYGTTDSARRTVAVVGSGAIGCVMASQAKIAGHDVTLCARTAFDRLLVEENGVESETRVPIVTQPDEIAAVDWVLLATKAQDTKGAAPWLERLVGPGTIVVALQNGIDHEQRLQGVAPAERAAILPALVYVAAERIAPGRVVHRNGRRIIVPQNDAGERFRLLLAGSALEIALDRDFPRAAWRKLLSNLAANPLTTLTLRRLDALKDPDMAHLAEQLLIEAVTVARAAGVALDSRDVRATLDLYGRFDEDGGTSMLYDRLAGRPLEHEHITGTVVQLAERHGVEVPLNRTILTLLRALDSA